MSSDIMPRLKAILEFVILRHIAEGNKTKAQEYMIYRKNLDVLSIVGITNLLKELAVEVDELTINDPVKVEFT